MQTRKSLHVYFYINYQHQTAPCNRENENNGKRENKAGRPTGRSNTTVQNALKRIGTPEPQGVSEPARTLPRGATSRAAQVPRGGDHRGGPVGPPRARVQSRPRTVEKKEASGSGLKKGRASAGGVASALDTVWRKFRAASAGSASERESRRKVTVRRRLRAPPLG